MARSFNYIYSKIVKDNHDLVGLVAYGQYKKKKVDFIKEWCNKNPGTEISEDNLELFHTISDHHVDEYRLQATAILHSYNQTSLESIVNEVQDKADEKVAEAEEEYTAALVNKLKDIKTPFHIGVLQSAVGSVFFMILIAAFMMVLIGTRIGISELGSEMLRIFQTIDLSHVGDDKIDENALNLTVESSQE